MQRHELPTHLHVEDKLIAGLTLRQVLVLSVGLSVAYSLWLHLNWLAQLPLLAQASLLTAALRLLLSAPPLLLAVACALVSAADRSLEDWLLVALRYLTLPKAAVWRSASPSFTYPAFAESALAAAAYEDDPEDDAEDDEDEDGANQQEDEDGDDHDEEERDAAGLERLDRDSATQGTLHHARQRAHVIVSEPSLDDHPVRFAWTPPVGVIPGLWGRARLFARLRTQAFTVRRQMVQRRLHERGGRA